MLFKHSATVKEGVDVGGQQGPPHLDLHDSEEVSSAHVTQIAMVAGNYLYLLRGQDVGAFVFIGHEAEDYTTIGGEVLFFLVKHGAGGFVDAIVPFNLRAEEEEGPIEIQIFGIGSKG